MQDDTTLERDDRRGGGLRRLSDVQRTKLFFFLAALLSFFASVALWFSGNREQGIFVGLWVPSILAAGILLVVGEEHRHE